MARILVIDDNDMARFALRSIMEAAGHDVQEAEDGKIALAVQAEFHADLVITDIVMPNKEGLETSAALLAQYPGIKIVVISGGGRLEPGTYLNVAKDLGAHAALKKPFDSVELEAIVEKLLA